MSDSEGRSRAAPSRALALAALFLASACAHGPAPAGPQAGGPAARRPPLELDPVYRPRDQRAARAMLEHAFSLADEGEPALAAAYFDAVLASDFLTDKGRANIYWVSAGLHRRIDDPDGEAAALGAFLVTAELLPDDDLEPRRLIARSVLAAHRVQSHPGLGRSPEAAIVVEDIREPASIIASLTCGEEGEARFIDVAIESSEAEAGGRLLRRRAECKESGAVLDLWFDLTYAENAEE